MSRNHAHCAKVAEAKKARRKKRGRPARPAHLPLVLHQPFILAWVCNDASCVLPHGQQ
jgi:hypothetical protein